MALKTKKNRQNLSTKQAALKEAAREETSRLNANIPKKLHKKLKAKAAMNDDIINELVITWVKAYVSK